MARPSAKRPKDVNPSQEASLSAAPSASSSPEETGAASSSTPLDVKAHLAKEIYERLKSNQYAPGYSILPADRAPTNGTVDSVLAIFGQDAICKMKSGIENLHMSSTRRLNDRSLVVGEEAKQLEATALTRPR